MQLIYASSSALSRLLWSAICMYIYCNTFLGSLSLLKCLSVTNCEVNSAFIQLANGSVILMLAVVFSSSPNWKRWGHFTWCVSLFNIIHTSVSPSVTHNPGWETCQLSSGEKTSDLYEEHADNLKVSEQTGIRHEPDLTNNLGLHRVWTRWNWFTPVYKQFVCESPPWSRRWPLREIQSS